jgi:ferrous iron transport protein A
VKLVGARPVRRRLQELGLTPGTEVRVVGVSPLGDPLELSVRGARVSIRKKEAFEIEVEA